MSFKIEHPWKAELLAGAAALLALAWVYLRTLSPAFPPNDSPETIAAAFSLGIQHPPGYPLAALLGRLAIRLLGLGSAAWRMNLLAAGLGLAGAALAGSLAWRLCAVEARTARLSAALLAGLGFGLWPALWEQATEAKGGHYLLNLALGLGLWHASLDARRGSRRAWLAALLLAGLMLAHHFLSAAPWLLVAGLWLAWAWRQGRLRARAADTAFLLPGLALYLYLPLRARLDPALDLGHPSNWAQFRWMLSRAGYGPGPALSVGLIQEQLGLLLRSFAQPLGLAAAALALGGGRWLWRRDREAALALGAAVALAVLAGAVLNSTPADNRWLVLIFTLPALALLLPVAGTGLGALAAARGRGAALWLALALALPLGSAGWRWSWQDHSASFTAWDYSHDLALSLPRGALYEAEGDYHVLPLLHLQVVEGRRRDVTTVLAVLSGEPWYQDSLKRRGAGLLQRPGPAAQAAPALVLGEVLRRPVILGPYAGLLNADALKPLQLRQRGLVREASPRFGDTAPDLAAAWASRGGGRPVERLEPVEAALLPWYTVGLVQAGNEALAQRRLPEALLDYRRALQRPGAKPTAAIAVNLAGAWEAAGSDRNARLAYEQALAAEPGFTAAREGLARLQARAQGSVSGLLARADRLAASGGRDRDALELYNQALQAGYQSANLWRNIGVIFLRNGDKAQAARAFSEGLRLKPGDLTLTQYLGVAAP